jgi:hypothetical protein
MRQGMKAGIWGMKAGKRQGNLLLIYFTTNLLPLYCSGKASRQAIWQGDGSLRSKLIFLSTNFYYCSGKASRQAIWQGAGSLGFAESS